MNKETVKSVLMAMPTGDFLEKSKDLLATLGYHSERTLELSGTVDDFIQEFEALNPHTKTEREFRKNAESVELVFQFTKDEIADDLQQTLFKSASFDRANTDSFIFCAVELKDNNYSRTKYAEFTREINKRLNTPTVGLFRVANRLTVGFTDRRPHKTDEERDVLGQVTLIKDIRLNNPHRAHLDLLSDLSLEECAAWIDTHNEPKNFDGLLAAWLAKLDTEALNKQFYRQLFDWFEWAVAEAKFPTNEKKILNPQEHVIRLITRLLFIWFLKEKGLVADELFNQTQIQDLLTETDFDNGNSYYRVVLQNLFFATLNTEIDKRGFSTGTNTKHRDFSCYRYEAEMRDSDALLALFVQTPFINGGLFDCLDSEEATGYGGYRIDCFSDVHYKKLHIPNRLFFDEQRGLFPLLNHYKFTVEENTPIEQEVALDPELLGKVFENLLAAYNPETGVTARRQTGSYYTPRPIVDYMVEEVLVATLSQKCSPTEGNAEFWEERLRYLFNYALQFDAANEWFDDEETDGVMRAISELKILDPAVGSGAFPMGMLHKLTLALRRLDPDNTRWETLQKGLAIEKAKRAFDTKGQQERDAALQEISSTFERYRDSDFGRKLYLIQSSIFGVDIQPVACQIAKLRFFISLAIEQETNRALENFGIKPLPNLETRFIAANTLIGLKGEQRLTSKMAQDLERELLDNRERHFHATTRQQKLACKKADKRLRVELATELKEIGMPAEDAEKLAHWDLYDQNASANFFDPEWMLGIRDGFDVVIGNPPYIKEYTFKHAFDGLRESPYYQGKMDIWYMFVCKGLDISKNSGGMVTFIAQNNWVTSSGASKMRNKVIKDAQVLSFIDFGSFKIFESGIQTMIMIFRKNTASDSYSFDYRRLHGPNLNINDVILLLNKDKNNKAEYLTPTIKRSEYTGRTLTFSDPEVELILEKISLKRNFHLDPNKEVAQGIVYPQDRINKVSQSILNSNFKVGGGIFALSQKEKDQIPFTKKELNLIKPAYTTKELHRYYGNPVNQEWVIYTDSSFKDKKKIENYPNIKTHLDQFRKVITSDNKPYGLHRARKAYFFQGEKILSVRKCARPTFTYVDFESYVSATFYVIKTERTNQKYLTGLLNSRLIALWLKHRGKMQGTNYQIDKQPLLAIPLFSPALEQQTLVEILVNQILDAKRTDLAADVIALESKIDHLVYSLYNLTPEEVAIVEAAEG